MTNRQSNAKVASAAYLIILVFTFFLLSIPPANLVFYIVMLVLAIVPLAIGTGPYRIFGMIAVVVSLGLIGLEIRAGINIKRERQKLIERFNAERQGETNAVVKENLSERKR